MIRTILIILVILFLLGYGGVIGDVFHTILHTLGGMSVTGILVVILIIVLVKKK